MSDLWTARQSRLDAITAVMRRPNWHTRVAGVVRRLTPSTCRRCGRTDYAHLLTCRNARASWGDTRIQFGNAVIRVTQHLSARRALTEMKAELRAHIAARGLVFRDGRWVRQ